MKMFRAPRSTQEARANSDAEAQGYVRPSRRVAALPNAWDDSPVRIERNWKSFRTTQYKG